MCEDGTHERDLMCAGPGDRNGTESVTLVEDPIVSGIIGGGQLVIYFGEYFVDHWFGL